MAWGASTRERRVLKAGHSSIAVTLPKPWAEAMNLRPGDLIVFDQNDDGTLFLKPAPPPGASAAGIPYLVEAHAFETPGLLERLVFGAYRVGHDAIEIRTEVPLAPERMEELQMAARRLLGVSVVAQEPNRVLLQNFVDPSKYGLPQLVQRMKMILIASIEESEALLVRGSRSRRLTSLSEETNRVLALLVRQLFLSSRDWSLARRIGSPDPRQLLEWRVVVHALEELGGLVGEIARELHESEHVGGEADEALPRLLQELKDGLQTVVETLMHPTLPTACEGFAESARLAESARIGARRLKGAARRNGVYTATVAVQRGAGCLAILSEVALDRAVSAGNSTVLIPSA
ncbi:MAG TPA: AbrB/MazE/SpoVT family DNA-binding domain-containing protein [Thermoplasmata archaeon]|nr:AbrB/MazE/SpoVT family DNA-binding domain-containing protein [Thermoplasmata archaeon]